MFVKRKSFILQINLKTCLKSFFEGKKEPKQHNLIVFITCQRSLITFDCIVIQLVQEASRLLDLLVHFQAVEDLLYMSTVARYRCFQIWK